jgi:hypothetical protein
MAEPTKKKQQKPPSQPFAIETVFYVMIAMSLIPRGEAIDAAHARSAALFRMTVTLVGVLGLIVTFFIKRSRAANAPTDPAASIPLPFQAAANPWDMAAGPQVAWQGIVATYAMTRQSALRNEKMAMKRNPKMLLPLLSFPTFMTVLSAAANWNKLSTAALIGQSFLVYFGMLALLAAISCILFFARFPKPDSVRRCTTYLSSDGIVDVTPDKTNTMDWSAIAKVLEEDGDLIFLPKSGSLGFCIPREAFDGIEAARRFYQAALVYWQSGGSASPSAEALREFGPQVAASAPEQRP